MKSNERVEFLYRGMQITLDKDSIDRFKVLTGYFRPKGAVIQYKEYNYNKALEKCGYYWLKDDPHNYRGSCTYSNSLRERQFFSTFR